MLFRNIFLLVATLGLAGALSAGVSTDYVTFKAPLPGQTYLNYHFSLNNADITFKRGTDGFDGAIAKPFSIGELSRVINQVLAE